jgi:light-regulated signal transduction histidine kinase (bacteriophytochrome)
MNRAAMEVGARLWPGFRALQILGRGARDIVTGLAGFSTPMFERNLTFVRMAITERRTVTFEDAIMTPAMQRIAEVNITPILDESGVVTHVLRNSRDITARRGAEEAIRRFNEDLERRVAERTAQLAMANRELEAFSYSLSHDLRAPLRAVEGFSTALLEDLEQGHTGELRDHAQRIQGAAQRMRRLVGDLLRLSQLGTVDLKREVIDMGQIAREIADQLRSSAPSRRVEIHIADGMQVRADARLIQVAMQNLMDNAWKYTSTRDPARIEVFQEDHPEGRVTVVRDNGVGFDPRYADRLFMPFARLHKETEFEGAGIGLATVHRVAMAHGGRVWATGEPGAGASFFMMVCNAVRTDAR